MNYYITNNGFNGSYLIHSTGDWKKHKYSSKTGSKNNYNYTYPKAVIDQYNANRRKAGKKKKSKFFKYVGGNFVKSFKVKYEDSEDENERRIYDEANRADTLLKRVNEGNSTNPEEDLAHVKDALDVINASGSDEDKHGVRNMLSEFMHDIKEQDPTKSAAYAKILGTNDPDIEADEKIIRARRKKEKSSTTKKKKSSTRKKKSSSGTKRRRKKKTEDSDDSVQQSAFDPLDYKYSIRW